MADNGKRTVRVGLMTYRNTAGQVATALEGQEVDVHADDLERFDRLNAPDLAGPTVAPDGGIDDVSDGARRRRG